MTQSSTKITWRDRLKKFSTGFQLAIVSSFILLWALFFWHLLPDQASWEVGGVAEQDVHADRSVTYKDKEATRLKEKEALKGF